MGRNENTYGHGCTRVLFRLAMTLVMALFVLSPLAMAPDAAFADRSNYGSQAGIGNQGWNAEVLGTVDNKAKGELSQDVEGYSQGIVDDTNQFLLGMMGWLIGISIVVCGGRFALRGIYEMIAGRNEDEYYLNMPTILMTAKERRGASSDPKSEGWISRMLVETAKYLAIALGATAILGLIVSLLMGAFGALGF